jgi:hypothetical protein
MTTTPARRQIDLAMSETQWQTTVTDLALTLHWRALHHHDSRRDVGEDPTTGKRKLVGDKDAAGLPDWLFIRERHFFAELKAEGKKPTAKQLEVLDALRKAGAEVHVWQPSDWPEVVVALTGRWRGGRGANAWPVTDGKLDTSVSGKPRSKVPPQVPNSSPTRTPHDIDRRTGGRGVSAVDTGGAT